MSPPPKKPKTPPPTTTTSPPVALIAAETPDDYHKIATQLPSGVTPGISISAHNPLNAWDMTQLTPRPLMINRG